jgi:hypothetical protein
MARIRLALQNGYGVRIYMELFWKSMKPTDAGVGDANCCNGRLMVEKPGWIGLDQSNNI